MDRKLLVVFLVLIGIFGCSPAPVKHQIEPQYGGYAPSRAYTPIRMLIVKHSREHMADGDADLAIEAANRAKAKGLPIQVVGNQFIDGRLVSYSIINNIDTLTSVVEQEIETNRTPGDTLIVFTIGHGMQSGGLHNIGQRSQVMQVLANAAEKHNQRMFWWQLSCHACASLPNISSLTPRQQELFTMVASSAASDVSAAGVQGRIMEKVFLAMAGHESSIDPNGDGVIRASELRTFLNTVAGRMGDRVFAQNQDTAIFGRLAVPQLPVVDRNGPQGKYDEDYIFYPR